MYISNYSIYQGISHTFPRLNKLWMWIVEVTRELPEISIVQQVERGESRYVIDYISIGHHLTYTYF